MDEIDFPHTFTLKADRMIAATAVVFGVEQFRGQLLDGNVLNFSTRQGILGKGLSVRTFACTQCIDLFFFF